MNNFLLLCGAKGKLSIKAVNKFYRYINGFLKERVERLSAEKVEKDELINRDIIYIGRDNTELSEMIVKDKLLEIPLDSEGFSLCVGKSPFDGNRQVIAVISKGEEGLYYGVNELIGGYFSSEVYKNSPYQVIDNRFYENVFENELYEFKKSYTPKIKRRTAWTWGHVIYDYKKYFENLADLKFNEVVIWNDYPPLNAKDVVNYAHMLNIKVVWGFAWGWDLDCEAILKNLTGEYLTKLKKSVVDKYEKEYKDLNGDGIYFQTFTETNVKSVNGKSVAEIVTEFVNDTAGELLSKYPNLEIQFGLHATSVKEDVEKFKAVDKRISIVWEDAGSFPYNYKPWEVGGFDETMLFTKRILTLRGKSEKYGSVLKGMINLDWTKFKHLTESGTLGEATEKEIRWKLSDRKRIWRYVQCEWFKNAPLLKKYIDLVSKNENSIVEILLEDGLFERGITFPIALLSQIMWEEGDAYDIALKTSKSALVKFY